jgi:hypothetical protein
MANLRFASIFARLVLVPWPAGCHPRTETQPNTRAFRAAFAFTKPRQLAAHWPEAEQSVSIVCLSRSFAEPILFAIR